MTVRLAFAVAAHLEPEILVVDEVLAVGDAEFQKKCLGKMGQVAALDARTILFVSHNMAAIESLCTRCIYLESGQVKFDGPTPEAIRQYLYANPQSVTSRAEFDLTDRVNHHDDGSLVARRIRILTEDGLPADSIRMGEGLSVIVEFNRTIDLRTTEIGMEFNSDIDQPLINVATGMKAPAAADSRRPVTEIEMRLNRLPLAPGRYWIDVGVWDRTRNVMLDEVSRGAWFDIVPADVYGTGYVPRPRDGVIVADFDWETREHSAVGD
jgi:lipopolysaccharide transport system ATP-binding protein